jgi:hypothetical protein
MVADPDDPDLDPWGWGEDPTTGLFADMSGNILEDVPDLQQLCPQLVHLRLTFDTPGVMLYVDKRVVQMLPANLQDLTLASPGRGAVWWGPIVLQHLTALRRLTLDGVEVELEEVAAVAQSLTALQQLQVLTGPPGYDQDSLLGLAPKLTGFAHCMPVAEGLGRVSQLVHLSRLTIGPCWGCGLPEGTTAALRMLTGLQHLGLDGVLGDSGDENLGDVLQQVAGMASLRSLKLKGSMVDPSQLSSGLAGCTQLTALTLLVEVGRADAIGHGPYVSVPRQLTRLCSLAVTASVVRHEGGAWLTPLSHLTRLCMQLDPYPYAVVEGHVWQVRSWPAIVQQVQRAVGPLCKGNTQPALWQFTPAVLGAAAVNLWLEVGTCLARGWAHHLQPCAHLPGVCELQGRADGSN